MFVRPPTYENSAQDLPPSYEAYRPYRSAEVRSAEVGSAEVSLIARFPKLANVVPWTSGTVYIPLPRSVKSGGDVQDIEKRVTDAAARLQNFQQNPVKWSDWPE